MPTAPRLPCTGPIVEILQLPVLRVPDVRSGAPSNGDELAQATRNAAKTTGSSSWIRLETSLPSSGAKTPELTSTGTKAVSSSRSFSGTRIATCGDCGPIAFAAHPRARP